MKTFKMAIREKRCVNVIGSGEHKIPLFLTTHNHYFVKKIRKNILSSGYGIVTGSVKVVWSGEVDPSLTYITDEAWFYLTFRTLASYIWDGRKITL